jgi:hypothetical protein
LAIVEDKIVLEKKINLNDQELKTCPSTFKWLKELLKKGYNEESLLNDLRALQIKSYILFLDLSSDEEDFSFFILVGNQWHFVSLSLDGWRYLIKCDDNIKAGEFLNKNNNIFPSMIYISLIALKLGIHEWNHPEIDDEWEEEIDILSNRIFESILNGNYGRIPEEEGFYEYFDEFYPEENSIKSIRIDIHPHHLPKIPKNLTKKLIKPKPKSKKKKEAISKLKLKKLTSILSNLEENWIHRAYALRILKGQNSSRSKNAKLLKIRKKAENEVEKEFIKTLGELELIDGYGEDNTPHLRLIIESIIEDMLANRPSNKLLLGPQGTGKSSFSKLLSRLLKAKLLTIECGPVTDNQDLLGSYEIQIDPETRQAITVFHENGLLYASKLVNQGERVVVAFEEYNLLPSEALLKQLNRCFQDRVLATLGGRHEIDNSDRKGDLVILLLGNYIPDQEWLEDVGLIRRFDFFELELPSTVSVINALYSFCISTNTNKRLTRIAAERIAEIRDDLVAALQEKTIRPLLSKEIRFPDLYTLRNFSLDLIHGVPIERATQRHLIKIILGGKPFDPDFREEYNNYCEIILQTVEDRLPAEIQENY